MRQTIPVEKLLVHPYDVFDSTWFLLTAGDLKTGQYNTMTISWGGSGCMWNKPICMVVVRPQRYTYQFMEKYDTFTLTAFPEPYRKALSLLGSRSGRDSNKIVESGLTPIASNSVSAPIFAEAELAIECRKIYFSDYDPSHFVDPAIDKNYPNKDYHRMYFGEILSVEGEDKYK
ncbi:MAG: flavin reductase family protein [Anaerolineaceae bacterium]|nr:flavin reductase family protein [Anaerolineaceae bacterium]